MKAWWPWVVAFVVPGGLILLALDWWRRRYEREHAPNYVQQIAVWKSEHPLALPAIQPLKAKPLVTRVMRFEQRLRATR